MVDQAAGSIIFDLALDSNQYYRAKPGVLSRYTNEMNY